MYIDKSLKDYVEDVSSNKSMPGGGSVAALVGSLGGALTNMLMNLTRNKDAFKELDRQIQEEMIEESRKIDLIIEELNSIIDEDTRAFNSVLAAFKLAKDTEKERLIRKKAIENGYKKALSVPFRCMELSLEIMERQKLFASYGNPGVITDVGIGCILAFSAIEASRLNVMINLKGIEDEEYISKMNEEVRIICNRGKNLKIEVLDIVKGIIN